MYRTSATKITATIIFYCWGCHHSMPIDIGDMSDIQIDQFGIDCGWIRREHSPGIEIWYCSENCAYNSYNAKTCDTYWEKVNYLKNRSIYQKIKAYLKGCIWQ